MSARDHSCERCGGGGLNSPPAPDCSCEPTWIERVLKNGGDTDDIAREMAAILDNPQRQEDEEAGRLLRELTPQVEWQDDGTWYVSGWKPGDDDWTRVTGPTPAAALRALRDAIGGEG